MTNRKSIEDVGEVPSGAADEDDQPTVTLPEAEDDDLPTMRLSVAVISQIALSAAFPSDPDPATVRLEAISGQDAQLDLPTIELLSPAAVEETVTLGEPTVELPIGALPAELFRPALPFQPVAPSMQVPFSFVAPPEGTPPPPLEPIETTELEVARVAAIAAEIAGGSLLAVLARRGLTGEQWSALERRWNDELAAESERSETSLRDAYDDAFLEARAVHRGRFDLDAFAELRVELEHGASDDAPAGMALDVADAMRFQRVWARRVAADPSLREKLEAATARVRSRRGG